MTTQNNPQTKYDVQESEFLACFKECSPEFASVPDNIIVRTYNTALNMVCCSSNIEIMCLAVSHILILRYIAVPIYNLTPYKCNIYTQKRISSKSVGSVSASYKRGSSEHDDYWISTSYGTQYLAMCKALEKRNIGIGFAHWRKPC